LLLRLQSNNAEVKLDYAVGVAEPVSVLVESFGTGKLSLAKLTELIRSH
jgi:S-adenosylmethionine synthetase